MLKNIYFWKLWLTKKASIENVASYINLFVDVVGMRQIELSFNFKTDGPFTIISKFSLLWKN